MTHSQIFVLALYPIDKNDNVDSKISGITHRRVFFKGLHICVELSGYRGRNVVIEGETYIEKFGIWPDQTIFLKIDGCQVGERSNWRRMTVFSFSIVMQFLESREEELLSTFQRFCRFLCFSYGLDSIDIQFQHVIVEVKITF